MNEFPKEQAQTLWLIRSQPFSIDTHPNLRQATTQDFRLATNLIIPTTNPRGTEWQEQLFRLVKLAPKRVGGSRGQALARI